MHSTRLVDQHNLQFSTRPRSAGFPPGQGHLDEISSGAAGLSTKDPYGGACAWVAGMVLTLLEASGFWRLRCRRAKRNIGAPPRTYLIRIRQPWYDSFRFIPFTLKPATSQPRTGPGSGGPRSAAPVCRIRTARFWRFRVYPGADSDGRRPDVLSTSVSRQGR